MIGLCRIKKRLFRYTWIATWISSLFLNTDLVSYYCLPLLLVAILYISRHYVRSTLLSHTSVQWRSGSTWWCCGCVSVGSSAHILLKHFAFFSLLSCFRQKNPITFLGFRSHRFDSENEGNWWIMKRKWCYRSTV